MCPTHQTESLSPPRPITIRVLINQVRAFINQDWDQDWEQNQGFKKKKYSVFIKYLHLP